MRRKRLFSLLAILTLLISLTITVPIVYGDGDGPEGFSVPEKQEQQYPNLGSHLNQLVASVEQGQLSAKQAAADSPIHSGGSVAVTIHLSGNVDDVVQFLEDNSGDPRNIGEDYIEAYVPVTLLGRLSQQPGVTRVWEIVPPEPAYGNVTSQAVSLHQANSWQDADFRGQGVKVGVIDLGFTGYSDLAGVELPANVVVRCYTGVGKYSSNLADCEAADEEPPASTPDQCYDYVADNLAGGEPHGTAVAEAVIDIAPDATLYIANPYSRGDLQETAAWMAEEGVTVINYSVGWIHYGSRGDGTSPFSDSPLNTVDRAVANGITWVNAAGNSAGDTWLGSYSDNDGDGLISFNNSTAEINPIDLRECRRYTFQLRWADSWDNAATDLDIFLWDTSTDSILDIPREWGFIGSRFSANEGIPFEFFSLRSPINSTDVGIIIVHRSGPEPDWIQLELFSGPGGLGYSNDGSIGNPAESANPGMLAVGAAPFYDTNTIEPFSSRGPTPDGRIKPDIVGVDCAASVSYELFTRRNSGQDCWFPGTSQASPHVAGLAALVKQRFPYFTPDQVADYLKYHAEERGTSGPDNTWGHGFAVLPSPDTDLPLDFDASCGQMITVDSTVQGQWTTDCNSQTLPLGKGGSGATLARYYTFTLDESSDVSVILESDDAETVLYLREGVGVRSGDHIGFNDGESEYNYRRASIEQSLDPGAYTIEATTYEAGETGAFTLAVSGAVRTTPPPVAGGCDIASITPGGSPVAGTWADDCQSETTADRNARYYQFTLAEAADVTITLESGDGADEPVLHLREGASKTGTEIAMHDGFSPDYTRAEIVRNLAAGTYTVEARTYSDGHEGPFTLTVSVTGGTTPPPTAGDCGIAEITVGQPETGTWADDCQSELTADRNARYYQFALTEAADVTITLESTNGAEEPVLHLRSGESKTGTELASDDGDSATGYKLAKITENLEAGTYTIEARTYSAGHEGPFTLTVSVAGGAGPAPGGCDIAEIGTDGSALSGTWGDDCQSELTADRNARYYQFTLDAASDVTITLESTDGAEEPVLHLRSGESKTGTELASDDGDSATGYKLAMITENLEAGTYTIEARTYSAGHEGPFTLTVTVAGGDPNPAI